jgi:hypothetical protein
MEGNANMKYLCVLMLLGTGFIFGCKIETEPYGTPPEITGIRLFMNKGANVDYAEEPEITEWKEGDVILGILTITDPDVDVTTVSYSYKCVDNNSTKSGGTQFVNQDKNPCHLGFVIHDLTPGNWILTITAKDEGKNSTTVDFDKILVVRQH